MPLHVSVDSVSYDGIEESIISFYIGRQEELKAATLGVHRYSLSPILWPWDAKGEFHHEYADGANICTQKALKKYPKHLLRATFPDSPVRMKVDLASYYTTDREIVNVYINKDNFPNVDNDGTQRYGIYHEVWPWELIAEFSYESDGSLTGCIIKALETIEGVGNG